MGILCGSFVWKFCMDVMCGNYVWKPVGDKLCMEILYGNLVEIVFDFFEGRGTDFQEVGGTGWRIHGGTSGSGFLYQGIKTLCKNPLGKPS